MLPVQLAGLALSGSTLLTKYIRPPKILSSRSNDVTKYKLQPPKIYFDLPKLSNPFEAISRGLASTPSPFEAIRKGLTSLPNPFEAINKGLSNFPSPFKASSQDSPGKMPDLTKGLTSTIDRIKKVLVGEDYNGIVKPFLPEGAVLLKPQFPAKAENIHAVDLDGDGINELVTTYKLNNEQRTLVLKKQNEKWSKLAEAANTEVDVLNYRGIADFSGSGKKHILLGMTSKAKAPTVYGYSIENGKFNELFKRNYSRLEVLPGMDKKAGAKLAVWKKEGDSHNIEILRWNGTTFESQKDISKYYLRKVVPYYAQVTKSMPSAPVNWYNLAAALHKAGRKGDALTAADVGMYYDKNAKYGDKFTLLKDEINGKLPPPPPKVEPIPVTPTAKPAVKSNRPPVRRRYQ